MVLLIWEFFNVNVLLNAIFLFFIFVDTFVLLQKGLLHIFTRCNYLPTFSSLSFIESCSICRSHTSRTQVFNTFETHTCIQTDIQAYTCVYIYVYNVSSTRVELGMDINFYFK